MLLSKLSRAQFCDCQVFNKKNKFSTCFRDLFLFSTAIVGVENKQNPSMDGITNKRQNRGKPKAFPVIFEDIHEPESEDEEKRKEKPFVAKKQRKKGTDKKTFIEKSAILAGTACLK